MTIFDRTRSATQAPGAAPVGAAHQIGFQAPQPQPLATAVEASAVVASTAGPGPEVIAAPALAARPSTVLVPAPPASAPVLTIPAELSAELALQLANAGFNPDSPCGLLDMGGVQESLGSSLPIVRIEYAQSARAMQAGLVRGQLINMATQEQMAQLRLVLLAVKLQRILWEEVYDQDKKDPQPLCMSIDGKTASRGEWADARKEGLAVGRPCLGCSFTQWRTVDRKRKPPQCAEVYTQLCIDRDAMAPVVYPAKRTGVKPFKAAYAQVQLKAMRWGLGLPSAVRQCSVAFTLRPLPVKNYYVPEYGNYEQVPAEEVQQYAAMLLGLLPLFAEVDISKEGNEDAAAEAEGEEGRGGYASASTEFAPGAYEAGGGQGGYSAPASGAAPANGGQRRKF